MLTAVCDPGLSTKLQEIEHRSWYSGMARHKQQQQASTVAVARLFTSDSLLVFHHKLHGLASVWWAGWKLRRPTLWPFASIYTAVVAQKLLLSSCRPDSKSSGVVL